jgi:hypothetical protein
MFSFLHRIKDRETAELLVDSLASYRRLYEYEGADSLRTFLKGATSSYVEAAPDGYTPVFRFDNELADFEFAAVLDPRYVLGPKGLQVQAQGLGPYLGFLASVSLSGRKLLFTGIVQSATFRAKALSRILLNEFDAIAYDQVPNPITSEVQSARPPTRRPGVDTLRFFQVGQCCEQLINGGDGHCLHRWWLSGIVERAPGDILSSCAVIADSHRTQGRVQTSSFPRCGVTIARGNAAKGGYESVSAQ